MVNIIELNNLKWEAKSIEKTYDKITEYVNEFETESTNFLKDVLSLDRCKGKLALEGVILIDNDQEEVEISEIILNEEGKIRLIDPNGMQYCVALFSLGQINDLCQTIKGIIKGWIEEGIKS